MRAGTSFPDRETLTMGQIPSRPWQAGSSESKEYGRSPEMKGKGITMNLIKKLWNDEEGPTSVEYALMVTLIAVAIIGAVTTLGQNIQASFTAAGNAINP